MSEEGGLSCLPRPAFGQVHGDAAGGGGDQGGDIDDVCGERKL